MIIGLVTVVALATRMAQNTMALGGLSHMLADWGRAAAYRAFDAGSTAPQRYFEPTLKGLTTYAITILQGQNYMIGPLGVAAILANLYYKITHHDWLPIGFWLYVSFCAVSWNFVMFQHSIIHVFTTRFGAWAALLAILQLSMEVHITFFRNKEPNV